MTNLLKLLYLACSNEDPATNPSLSDYYDRTDRAKEALCSIGEDPPDTVTEYGEAMEEQGFINGIRYGASLAHQLDFRIN